MSVRLLVVLTWSILDTVASHGEVVPTISVEKSADGAPASIADAEA